jgi:hypothetical protein
VTTTTTTAIDARTLDQVDRAVIATVVGDLIDEVSDTNLATTTMTTVTFLRGSIRSEM